MKKKIVYGASLALMSIVLEGTNQNALAQGMDAQTQTQNASPLEKLGIQANNLETIIKLDLSGKNLGAQGIQELAQAFAKMKNLESLNLKGNNLQDDGAILLSKQLEHLDNLKELNLGNNQIGDNGLSAIAKQMYHIPKLSNLNLESNTFSPNGVKIFAQYLFSVKLRELFLDNNPAAFGDTNGRYEALKSIQSAAENKHLESLEVLSLARNKLFGAGQTGGSAIGNLIQHLTNLTDIDVNDNNLQTTLISVVIPFMDGKHKKITAIDIGNNPISRQDIVNQTGLALVETIGRLSTFPDYKITSINMENCSLTDDAGIKLASVLKNFKNLVSINLEGNQFSQETKDMLKKFLKGKGIDVDV